MSAPHAISFFCLTNSILVPITPQYASRSPRIVVPHLKLCGIDLLFSWKTNLESSGHPLQEDEDDPFAAHCPLAYMTMFNDVISRFVTWQLARSVEMFLRTLLRGDIYQTLGDILLFLVFGARYIQGSFHQVKHLTPCSNLLRRAPTSIQFKSQSMELSSVPPVLASRNIAALC